jgi:hypothetical protein
VTARSAIRRVRREIDATARADRRAVAALGHVDRRGHVPRAVARRRRVATRDERSRGERDDEPACADSEFTAIASVEGSDTSHPGQCGTATDPCRDAALPQRRASPSHTRLRHLLMHARAS